MKIINQKIKIIEEVKKYLNGFKEYRAEDLNGNPLRVLYIEFEDRKERKEFIQMLYNVAKKSSALNSNQIIRNYGMLPVREVDGDLFFDTAFIYVVEDTKKISIKENLPQMINDTSVDMKPLFDICLNLFNILSYMEYMGLHYSFFSNDNVFFKDTPEGRILCVESPVFAWLNMQQDSIFRGMAVDERIFFDMQQSYRNENEFHQISRLLMDYLHEDLSQRDLGAKWNNLKKILKEKQGLDKLENYALIQLLDKMINTRIVRKPFIYKELIEDLNEEYLSNFDSMYVDRYQNLKFNALRPLTVLKDRDLRDMESTIIHRKSNNFALFMSRNDTNSDILFSKDFEYEFLMKGFTTLYFGANESEKLERGMINMISTLPYEPKTVREFGGKEFLLETLLPYMQSPFPGLTDDLDPYYCKLMLLAAELVAYNLPIRETLFIVDNISKMSNHIFYFLLVLFNVVKDNKIILLMRYEEDDFIKKEVLRALRDYLNERDALQEFELHTPDRQNIEVILMDLFNNNQLKKDFLNLCWEKTKGKVSSIREMAEYGVKKNLFAFNKDLMSVEVRDVENYEMLISGFKNERRLREALFYDFQNLREEEKDFLKKYSSLMLDYSLEDIAYIFSYDMEKLKAITGSLWKQGYLETEAGHSITYSFIDKALKDIVYESLSDEEKEECHRLILERLPNMEASVMLWHQKELGERDFKAGAISTLNKLIKEEYENRDYEKTIYYIQTLLEYPISQEDYFKNELNLLFLYETIRPESDFASLAEEMYLHIPGDIDKEILDQYYGMVVLYAVGVREDLFNKAKDYIEMRINKGSSVAATFYYLYLGNKSTEKGNFEEAFKHYNLALAFAGEDIRLLSLRGAIKRSIGRAAYFNGDLVKAQKYTEDAIIDHQISGDISGEIKCRLNLGAYLSYAKSTRKKAMLYYEEVLNLSSKYHFHNLELRVLLNLSQIYGEILKDPDKSLKYARAAGEVMIYEDINNNRLRMASTLICAEMNSGNFRNAYECYQTTLWDIKQGKYENTFANERSYVYLQSAQLLFELRNFETLKSLMEFVKMEEDFSMFMDRSELQLYDLMWRFVLEGEDVLEELLRFANEIDEEMTDDDELFGYINIVVVFEKIAIFLQYNSNAVHYSPFIKKTAKLSSKIWQDIYEVGYLNVDTLLLGIFTEGIDYSKAKEILELLKHPNLHRSYVILSIIIAEYYMDNGRFWEGIARLFEGVNILSNILRQIPFYDRVNFVKYNDFAKPLAYLNAFLKGNPFPFKVEYEREVPQDNLETLIYETDLYSLALEKEVLKNLYEENIERGGEYIEPESTLAFGDDDRENLRVMLEFLSHRLMTEEAYICLFENGTYNLVAKTRSADEKFFNDFSIHLDLSKFHIIYSGDYVIQGMQSVMCLPIYPDTGFVENSLIKPVGSVVFVSKKLLHLLSPEGFERIKEFGNLLSLLVENDKLNREENVDKLTGAMTRKALEKNLTENISASDRNNAPFTILMYDFDRFKSVNDIFGHLAGDKVLKTVSEETVKILPKGAKLGRYGGEEFIITLPGMDEKEGYNFAETLRKHIKQITFDELRGGNVTISIGVAKAKDERERNDALVLRADEALYHAKENGRNISVIWQKAVLTDKVYHERAGKKYMRRMRDPLYRLAFVEILQRVDKTDPPEVKLYYMLNRIMELQQATEVRIALIVGEKPCEVYCVKRGERQLFIEDSSKAWIDKFLNKPEGFFSSNWVEEGNINPITGYRDRNSIMCLPVLENKILKGAMCLLTDIKEKEFESEDFAVMKVFCTFFANVLKELEMIYHETCQRA